MGEFNFIEYSDVILVAPPMELLKQLAFYGAEMPEGLTSAAQMFFQKARCIYRTVAIEEQGKREMVELERAYAIEEQTEERNYDISQFWSRIEGPARIYAFSAGTPEGDDFYASVYRLPKDWRLKRGIS